MSIKEQIRAEIKRRLKCTHDWLRGDENRHPNRTFFSKNYYKMKGGERTLDALLNFLDSLPEQPVEGLENEIQRYFDGWGEVGDGDNIVTKNSDYIGLKDLPKIARHFAEWGRKQVLQEIYDGKVKPVDKITAAWLDDEQNT